jgi:hypothetical protein
VLLFAADISHCEVVAGDYSMLEEGRSGSADMGELLLKGKCYRRITYNLEAVQC